MAGGIYEKDSVRILESGFEDDEPEVKICPICLKPLGERIYKVLMPGEAPPLLPSDHDSWLQCHRCWRVYAKYEIPTEDKLESFTELVKNPHDIGGSLVGIGNKKTKLTRVQEERKKQHERIEREKDPDIKRELMKGLQVDVIEDALDY